jgi:hypothetical protein
MKKVVKFLYPILSLLLLTMLTACSSKPPKYNGESAKAYGEKLGEYYGEKLKNAGAKNIRKYLNESNKVIENLPESIPHLTNKQLVEKVDDTIKKFIDLSDKYLDIGEEDYKFLANPLKYYGIYDDYSKLVQIQIGDKGGIQLLSTINELIERSYGKKFYTPLDVKYDLLGALVGDDHVFFYKNALAKQIDKADKYYYVLTHTKYKIFFGDDDWIKEYKSEKDIINTAIKIAKKEKLYFDVDENKLKKLKEKIHNLKFYYSFKLFSDDEKDKNFNKVSIIKLKKIVFSKGKEKYRKNFNPIKWAERDLNAYKRQLINAKNNLQKHPNNGQKNIWVERYKQQVIKKTEELKQANEEFEKNYNQEISKLNERIKQLLILEKKFKEYNEKYQHNIKVFVKTLKNLFNKGYSETQIADSLLGGDYDCNKKDIMSIDTNKNLDTWNRLMWNFMAFKRCFREYMKKMKKLLSNQ